MEQKLQVTLLDELVDLEANKSPYLDDEWVKTPSSRYYDEAYFRREREAVFLNSPRIACHVSEVSELGSFHVIDQAGRPIVIVRGQDGVVRAFYNVCRHRGAQLVGEASGCTKRFSCPYHAWTWNSEGELIGVPHEKTGFPDMDRSEMGLHQLACHEALGWIWISQGEDFDVAEHMGELYDEFAALDAPNHEIFKSETWEFTTNWKLLVEGGLEAYHFRVAHRKTIAPLFQDNLSSYRVCNDHIRSVLPRSHLSELTEQPKENWNIRTHSNVLYTIFPSPQFLVQEDHFVWVQIEPLAADRTRIRLSTMVPKADLQPEREKYWLKNHEFTVETLSEDFSMAEGIQKGFVTEANEFLNFGRFEGALEKFNDAIERRM